MAKVKHYITADGYDPFDAYLSKMQILTGPLSISTTTSAEYKRKSEWLNQYFMMTQWYSS